MNNKSYPTSKTKNQIVPVIDIFAGPGGLGEGFSSYQQSNAFKIRLSIEKDPIAYRTLLLRSFFRQFPDGKAPKAYYNFVRQQAKQKEPSKLSEIFKDYPAEVARAEAETRCATLGKEKPEIIYQWIKSALGEAAEWVLIGGPPCQAYSLVGRSRNKGRADYQPEADDRQYLYVEYLQLIADHRPAVFVMENVKGLLSATLNNQHIFARICEDLQNPVAALGRENRPVIASTSGKTKDHHYRLFSIIGEENPESNGELFPLTEDTKQQNKNLNNFVVRMEQYGIPQARHRVIILGIREDLGNVIPKKLMPAPTVKAEDILSGLPRLRSGLSKESDTAETWLSKLQEIPASSFFKEVHEKAREEVTQQILITLKQMQMEELGRGGEFMGSTPSIDYRPDWFLDARLKGVSNHSSRGHIVKDLYRYFYAACYAQQHKFSPSLKHFPKDLLPEHANVKEALKGNNFSDRFRVQLASRPATTVTSHIAKDGHYYIHYDPTQCRSLTVREAARLQTFPDNYFFCGNRTTQYIQVGNAVPPLLASQIAEIVYDVLKQAGVIN